MVIMIGSCIGGGCVDDHEVEDRCGRVWPCQRAESLK